jgi:hypothetical protein
MRKKGVSLFGIVVIGAAIMAGLGACTTTAYLGIVTPHDAVEVLSDNVQAFEGPSYDAAIVKAGSMGFEVILSYEGRNLSLFGVTGIVRVIAKDADGIRPEANAAVPGPAE